MASLTVRDSQAGAGHVLHEHVYRFFHEHVYWATGEIVDIGMHLELEIPRDNPFGFRPGETWNAELGFEFLRAHSRMETEFLKAELNRYLGWPGQAPSYKIGERIWLQARD